MWSVNINYCYRGEESYLNVLADAGHQPSTTAIVSPNPNSYYCMQTIYFHNSSQRFGFDGKVRVSNFLNGFDSQLAEARARMSSANTATHTRYDFSNSGTGNLSISMAAEMAKSINSCSTMRSGRSKSATARSLVANDTRYAHLDEPHADHVGPGAYDVSRAAPGVGQLPLDSHTSSAMPRCDPYRASAPFQGPERPGSAAWVRPQGMCGPDAFYISPEFVPAPDHAARWEVGGDQRFDAAEWRHGHARVMAAVVAGAAAAAAVGAPLPERPFSSDLATDVAGRPLDMSLRATLRNGSGVSFTSKEPRLTSLPPERTSDIRASRVVALRGPEETAHLGPGAYSRPISVGGPRRRTYRLFVDPLTNPQPSDKFGPGPGTQADAAAVVAAHEHGTARAAAARAAAVAAAATGGNLGPSGANSGSMSIRSTASGTSTGTGPGGRLAPSPAFSGPFRSHKAGAFDYRTDSSLVRY
ncbi:hypothetical protein Agub_g13803 [Astrephomene gubernaculifera]|uniref:Uncharacterized protein n=1 Tax=Astrephomene gubernaculifera TaxID=47775 RepID=A0AAD3E4L8_9CHLO|nr:hypothetical protein Agub_g13803 [Astrephomene gubernaculifera]